MKIIKKQNVILSDLHTHTVASGHAFNTAHEMIAEAKKRGIKLLGIADHGPNSSAKVAPYYFSYGAKYFPRNHEDLEVLFGVEANIINEQGELDLSEKRMQSLDYAIASFHASQYKNYEPGIDVTTPMLHAIENPLVKIIAHPYSRQFSYDFEKIVDWAMKNNTIIEINTSFFYKGDSTQKEMEGIKEVISLLQKNKQKTIVNSDAHIINQLGCNLEIWEQISELGLREEDILNNNISELKRGLLK